MTRVSKHGSNKSKALPFGKASLRKRQLHLPFYDAKAKLSRKRVRSTAQLPAKRFWRSYCEKTKSSEDKKDRNDHTEYLRIRDSVCLSSPPPVLPLRRCQVVFGSWYLNGYGGSSSDGDDDNSKKAPSAKSKKGKNKKKKSKDSSEPLVPTFTTCNILEEAEDEMDDIYFPPPSRNTTDEVNHITALPADLAFIRQMNLEASEEPTAPASSNLNSLKFQEYDTTLDVEASEKREALYEQIVDEAEAEDGEDADVLAIANYDHSKSTATFTIPGKGPTVGLCDTGAGVDMLRENMIPDGAPTRQLRKPMFVTGFNGSPAERISTVVKLALETKDGASFKPRWFYVTKMLNYGIFLSKKWLNVHECHWQMSSVEDKVSLLSTNRGRVTLDAKSPVTIEVSVCAVRPREAYKHKKFLNEELDGEVVGRLVLRDTVTVGARQGVELAPLVQFLPEEGSEQL